MKLYVPLLLSFIGYSDGAGGAAKEQFESYERAIQFKVDNGIVYRNVSYVDGKGRFTLTCIPPLEEKEDTYSELAIYFGRGDSREPEPICTAASTAGKCTFNKNPPSLSITESASRNYTCRYVKDLEPPAKPAEVVVYSQTNTVTAYGDDNQPLSEIPKKVKNDTSPRFVCPGNAQDTTVNWYRNEMPIKTDSNYEVNSTNYNLTFKTKGWKVLDGSRYGGWYRCERLDKEQKPVAVNFFKISSNAFVAAPHKSYNRMEGESVTMGCDVEGEPVPKVRWERRDEGKVSSLNLNNDRIKYGGYKGIPNASITIERLVEGDYGDYVCVADEDDSHAEASTLLRVRSRLAALWPFLGIVAEVIILVAIIFIYEKRRMKKEQEETEDTVDQKKSLTASNNESKDVRQRKA